MTAGELRPITTALAPRIACLRERVLARGGAAQGAPGYRAWASMLAHSRYGARTWGQYRAYMLLALAEIAPVAITDDLTDADYATKMAFWKCALAVCDAGILLGQRYAAEARRQATICADPERRDGCNEMTYIILDATERLELAQRDPEHYGNIAVRVSGYSSKFCLLTKELQDHIIARTKHKCGWLSHPD